MIKAQFVLTEACNLNCSYCYVQQKNIFMSKEVFDTSFAEFKGRQKDTDYSFDFFGGEPLLNWDLIVYIGGVLKEDKHCQRKTLVTNGLLLTQEKVNFLNENSIKCMISFDGIWSDKRGPNLIPKYLEKKHLFKQLGGRFNTMIHPDSLNLVANYEFVISEFGMVPNFKLIRDDVWKKEHIPFFKKEFGDLCSRFEYYLTKEKKIYLVDLIQNYLYLLKIGLVDGHTVNNCGAGTEMTCYTPNGEKFPCERYASNNISSVGKLSFEECTTCELEKVCEKGCLYQNNTLGINLNLCEIYKCIFEEVINLNRRLTNNLLWKQIVRNLDRGDTYEP